MMPLKPYISYTTEQLLLSFSMFSSKKVDYVLPAKMTLQGEDKASSKTLRRNAIKKHYPELATKYAKFFANDYEMPQYYQNAFYKKMKALCAEYAPYDSILDAATIKFTYI